MNKIFEFFRKYRLCVLLSVIMVIGVFLSTVYADLYKSGSDYMSIDLLGLYLIIGMPLYSLIYGCLSYVRTKKIWLPQLILYSIACIYFFFSDLIIDKEIDAWAIILLFSVYPVAFSLVGASITAFICYIIKLIKEERW